MTKLYQYNANHFIRIANFCCGYKEVFTLELYLILKYELHTYLFNTDLGNITGCRLNEV